MKYAALAGIWLALVQSVSACPLCASGGPADYVKFDDSDEIFFTPVNLKKWSVSVDARSVSSSEGRDEEESHGQDQVGISLAYRPNGNVFFLARVPYASATLSEEGGHEQVNRGIADSELMATYEFKRGSSQFWPALSAVVKLPTGDNELQSDDSDASVDRLEEHGQLGTGSVDGMLMGHLRWNGIVRMNTTAGCRYNSENTHDFRYGSVVWFDHNVNRSIYGNLWGGVSARLRSAGRNVSTGEREADSGGTILLLMPEAGYSFGNNLSLYAQCSFPLVNQLNGTQEEKLGVSVALTQSF